MYLWKNNNTNNNEKHSFMHLHGNALKWQLKRPSVQREIRHSITSVTRLPACMQSFLLSLEISRKLEFLTQLAQHTRKSLKIQIQMFAK